MGKWNIFIGIRDESGEYLVGTPEGVIKVRSIRRKGSEEERWNWEEIEKVKGLPWQPTPGVQGYDIRPTTMIPDKGEKPSEGAKVKVRNEAKYKGLYIYPTDLENFGYTDGRM